MMHKISLILFLFVFAQFNVCFGQTYKLLVYGLQNSDMQTARDIVSEKWGIEFYPAAGCVVSAELMDSINQYNRTIIPLIKAKYGENWAAKFYREIDEEFGRELEVMAVLDETDFLINKKKELAKNGKRGFLYSMYPIKNSTEYNVSASIWGELEGETGWVSYYRLRVDHENKKITLLSDEIVRDEWPY